MASRSHPQHHQQMQFVVWRGAGGAARWDEGDKRCSHLHLSPRLTAHLLVFILSIVWSHLHVGSWWQDQPSAVVWCIYWCFYLKTWTSETMILIFCNTCVALRRKAAFFFFFNQWHCLYCSHKPSHLFSPFQCRRSTPDYFYPVFHYHNKAHAWKTDKLKETGQPEIWIWEAYFHLSFMSFTLLCCPFLFAFGEIESDMPFLSACASLWCFSGLLFCVVRA